MANATSGWIPTITVSAPRRRIIWAISSACATQRNPYVPSPSRQRSCPRAKTDDALNKAMRRCSRSASERAAWIVAIELSLFQNRNFSKLTFFQGRLGCKNPRAISTRARLVAEQSLSLLNTHPANRRRIHLPRSTPMLTRSGQFREERPVTMTVAPRSVKPHGLNQVVGNGHVHGRDTCDIDDHDLGAVGADTAEQLFGGVWRARCGSMTPMIGR